VRLAILDRYMLSELGGPFGFGLAAFTMIFAATQLLAIGRLVSDQHAPLWAAVEVFLWSLPGIVDLVLAMALLLGTLLAIQRLSGESEITAMKASGITFLRIVAPLLVAGLLMSFVSLIIQERIAPYANDQVDRIEDTVINNGGSFSRDLTVQAPLPGGGRQVTVATAEDIHAAELLHVTLIQYDPSNRPTKVVFADRAQFLVDRWKLYNASVYLFDPTGNVTSAPNQPVMNVELGQNPASIARRITHNDPQQMSRSQIAEIVRSGQLSETDVRKYVAAYWQKLAQPFACFVFVLIAVPFGLRTVRGGGDTSLGFGLAVAIVFVYYVVMTVCSYLAEAMLPIAVLWAWLPNILFTAIGTTRLLRAAAI
jgi:lipopolysaccharide export system permease protein